MLFAVPSRFRDPNVHRHRIWMTHSIQAKTASSTFRYGSQLRRKRSRKATLLPAKRRSASIKRPHTETVGIVPLQSPNTASSMPGQGSLQLRTPSPSARCTGRTGTSGKSSCHWPDGSSPPRFVPGSSHPRLRTVPVGVRRSERIRVTLEGVDENQHVRKVDDRVDVPRLHVGDR